MSGRANLKARVSDQLNCLCPLFNKMTSKWCCLLGSLLIAVLLSAKATVAFSPTHPLRTQVSRLSSTNRNIKPKEPFEMNTKELQVANVEAAQKSLDIADTANTIAAFSVAISALVPLLIAYVANNKIDTIRVEDQIFQLKLKKEDQIFQTSLKEREEIFQLELKKLETNNKKKKHDIQALIDAKKCVTPKSLSTNQRSNLLNDGAVAWLKKQTVAEQGNSLPWLT